MSVSATSEKPVLRLLILLLLMLWPWLVVGFGLYVLDDYRAAMLLYGALCGLLPVLMYKKLREPFLPLGMGIGELLGIMLVSNLVLLGIFKFSNGLQLDWPTFQQKARLIQLYVSPHFWGFGLYFIILNPLFEEWFWRGIVYRELKNYLPVWPANLVSSFFFGAWHWVILQHFCSPMWSILLSIVVMLGGVIFARAYEKTGALMAPILLHSLGTDLPILFVVYSALNNGAILVH